MIELSENIKLFADDSLWIEGESIRQLKNVTELKGIKKAIGMPDLHPGKGGPVGAAFLSSGVLYPHLAGNDIGCGMGLSKTTLKANKIKRDKWAKKLAGLEEPWDGDIESFISDHELEPTPFDNSLGTIGGGNHFAELQVIDKIIDNKLSEEIGLEKKNLYLLIHSGSRALGEFVLRRHADKYRYEGLDENSEGAKEYIVRHDKALKWAASNRALIAERFVSILGGECIPVLDLAHNSITRFEAGLKQYWIHRKGVAPSGCGYVIIPGSRGSLTYIVQPAGDQGDNLYSIAHGAGRKWNRSGCKGKLKNKYPADSLTHTSLGSIVICDDKELLYEEAPQAYKDVDAVVDYLQKQGLIKVIAALHPVITYKVRKNR